MNLDNLVKEAKHGSEAAQKCLFDILSDRMMLVCRRYVKNSEDAEEVLLDGFFKFFRKLHQFTYRSDAELVGWLKKIMVNECLMLLRKKNVFTIIAETAASEIAFEEDALNNLSAKEIFERIVQLPVGYRTIFNLYEVEGYNHNEIASMLNIAEGTSKSQLSKAKALLQKNIMQHAGLPVKQNYK